MNKLDDHRQRWMEAIHAFYVTGELSLLGYYNNIRFLTAYEKVLKYKEIDDGQEES